MVTLGRYQNNFHKWSSRVAYGDNNEQNVESHWFRPEILSGSVPLFWGVLKMYGSVFVSH